MNRKALCRCCGESAYQGRCTKVTSSGWRRRWASRTPAAFPQPPSKSPTLSSKTLLGMQDSVPSPTGTHTCILSAALVDVSLAKCVADRLFCSSVLLCSAEHLNLFCSERLFKAEQALSSAQNASVLCRSVVNGTQRCSVYSINGTCICVCICVFVFVCPHRAHTVRIRKLTVLGTSEREDALQQPCRWTVQAVQTARKA
jgi:hypothetical protein